VQAFFKLNSERNFIFEGDKMSHTICQYTTKKGYSVEYSVVGKGEPILIMHGGHSNCKEELGYSELTGNGYSVITPSRPGYGNTSKELGVNINTACEAYIELLDALGIAQVHVIAISAGGPSGIHFASRYPQRVRSLSLQSAVAQRWLTPDDKLYKSAQIMFRPSNEKYLWAMIRFMNKWFSSLLSKSMIASFSLLPSNEVLRQISQKDRNQFKKMLNRQQSGHGFLIDLEQTGHDLTSVLSTIQCPTLILHSIHDPFVSVAHARYAHQHVPHSKLCELNSWGHLIWIGDGATEMFRKQLVFLDNH
jgi:pimeloyl-ACP methyl ester carboxylesterase